MAAVRPGGFGRFFAAPDAALERLVGGDVPLHDGAL
jgi:hypothetical protein